MDKATKFAWAYLLTYGKLTNGKWSFYGSNWEGVDGGSKYDKVNDVENIKEKALVVGVDWTKTEIPEVSHEEGFNGTFSSHCDTCLGTIGTLVLKNGEKFLIGSADDDAAHLAETAREMRKGKDNKVEQLACKL